MQSILYCFFLLVLIHFVKFDIFTIIVFNFLTNYRNKSSSKNILNRLQGLKIYFHFNLFVLTINDTKIFLDNYNCSITRKQFWGQIIYSTNISFFLSFFDLVKYDGFITYFFTQAMPFFWSDLQISFENSNSIKTKD